MSKFKVGHSAICIKKTQNHNVGDVLLIENIDHCGMLYFGMLYFGGNCAYSAVNFTPCPNPPLPHYKERIAHALGADIEIGCGDGLYVRTDNPEFLERYNYRVAIPDIHAEERESIKLEIAELQKKLEGLGGGL